LRKDNCIYLFSFKYFNLHPEITIKPVITNHDFKTFLLFPYLLNKNNENWVPPLLMSQKQLLNNRHLFWQRNPYKFFLTFKEGRCTGRIAAFVNKEHNEYHKTMEGCFGFLEAENDINIFNQLLLSAEEFVRQNYCTEIIGPLNPSLHYELGVLTKGFEYPPYFMLTHNFKYYDEQIQLAGYQKLKDFYSYKMDSSGWVPTEKMKRVSEFLRQRYAIQVRQADRKFFDRELEIFFRLYNDAFTGHWGFTPLAKEEFGLLAKDLKTIIDPQMVLIAEINQEPVAFLLCLPNLNEVLIKIKNGRLFPTGLFKLLFGKKRIHSVRVITAAVKKSHEHLGLGALLYPELMKRGLQLGYRQCELSWVAEDNAMMIRIAEKLNALPYKTYRLYSKRL
jgi:hypothetical protein